jgi:hypothetical protein
MQTGRIPAMNRSAMTQTTLIQDIATGASKAQTPTVKDLPLAASQIHTFPICEATSDNS